MNYYYYYKSDKPEKKYYIITKMGKHIYVLVRLPRLILLNIKMKKEKLDILIGTSIMKIGVNQE
jgi:hypothetical protein